MFHKKSFKKFLSIILSILLLGILCMQILACDVFNDAIDSDQILKPIDDKSNIYEKIDELAMAKTRANQYASMYSDFPGDKVYSALLADIDRIRNELDQLGAIPSTEEINALFFQEPMQIQGVLIEDFADFENTFGEVYDLFGISQTVNASYGTFYCYDVVIQDHENHGLLATHIRQGPSAGYDLYAEGSSVKNIIGEEIGKIFFDKAYDIIVSGSRYARILNAAKTALTTIIGMVDSTSPASAVTANGNSSTHRIFCDITPSVHMIFVRNSNTAPWIHTYTSNVVSVREAQSYYYVVNIGNGQTRAYSGNPEENSSEYKLFVDDWGYRYTNAISAYRDNSTMQYTDMVASHTFYIEKDGVDTEVFTVDVTCPIDQNDLFRYAMQ